jgi:hypothetical protein
MWGEPKSNSKFSFVYILRDRNHPDRFNIGMSDDPDRRAKQEDWRLYGKKGDLPAFIEVLADWSFLTPLAAHYVEQSIIRVLRSQAYKEIDKDYNWFEIDQPSLQFFLEPRAAWPDRSARSTRSGSSPGPGTGSGPCRSRHRAKTASPADLSRPARRRTTMEVCVPHHPTHRRLYTSQPRGSSPLGAVARVPSWFRPPHRLIDADHRVMIVQAKTVRNL